MAEKLTLSQETLQTAEGAGRQLLARLKSGDQLTEELKKQLIEVLSNPGQSPAVRPEAAQASSTVERVKNFEELAKRIGVSWNLASHGADRNNQWKQADIGSFREGLAHSLGIPPERTKHVDDWSCRVTYEDINWFLPYPDRDLAGNIGRFYDFPGGGMATSVEKAGYIKPTANIQGINAGNGDIVKGKLITKR